MEFIFNTEKLKKAGYDEEQCLKAIRKHFYSYKSKTIKEIKKEYLQEQMMTGMPLDLLQDFHIQIGF